jgi:hypothetical protein
MINGMIGKFGVDRTPFSNEITSPSFGILILPIINLSLFQKASTNF